eukprot:TRINITY_DN9199_c0_g1_i1.p1 TRINITY_DN9199_c0_g1~~TRINITY_DN9199_c0_g1_i1.p1  ORF type:complete len:453 (-),score=48.29 TRINITY_DN9199_c0_g1_i1:9-1367(-)
MGAALTQQLQTVEQTKRLTLSGKRSDYLGVRVHDAIDKLLSVGLNRLTLTCGLGEFPVEVGRLTCLTRLNLSYNRMASIPDVITELRSLNELNLDANRLSTFPLVLCELTTLQSLLMNGNKLREVPRQISQLVNLRDFSLQQNMLATLPSEIGCLTGLMALYIQHNQLQMLPPQLDLLINLRVLNMSFNYLNDLPSIGALESLSELDVSGNLLDVLPPSICQLTSLDKLFLDGNQLTALPDTMFSGLSNLSVLCLQNNALVTLPAGIAQLRCLNELRLDGNRISCLAPELGSLPHLVRLSAASEKYLRLPPPSVVSKGPDEIRAFLRTLEQHGVVSDSDASYTNVIIAGTDTRKDFTGQYTVYMLKVSRGDRTWLVARRYNSFFALHLDLHEMFALYTTLPELPPKRMLGNFNTAIIAERRAALERYLQHVCLWTHGIVLPPLAKFLSPPDD